MGGARIERADGIGVDVAWVIGAAALVLVVGFGYAFRRAGGIAVDLDSYCPGDCTKPGNRPLSDAGAAAKRCADNRPVDD